MVFYLPTLKLLTMASAIAEVFDTVELLEMILKYLDIKTLLLSQRVNSTFGTVISDSKTLQEQLFFRTLRDDGSRPENFVLNPLFFRYRSFVIDSYGSRLGILLTDLGRVCARRGSVIAERSHGRKRVLDVCYVRPDSMPKHPWDETYGSWRRMFLRQEPFPVETYSMDVAYCEFSHIVDTADGETLGETVKWLTQDM